MNDKYIQYHKDSSFVMMSDLYAQKSIKWNIGILEDLF